MLMEITHASMSCWKDASYIVSLSFVEEFLAQWEPEKCILDGAQHQQREGFDITSITNLDNGVPIPLLEKNTIAKRP